MVLSLSISRLNIHPVSNGGVFSWRPRQAHGRLNGKATPEQGSKKPGSRPKDPSDGGCGDPADSSCIGRSQPVTNSYILYWLGLGYVSQEKACLASYDRSSKKPTKKRELVVRGRKLWQCKAAHTAQMRIPMITNL